MKATPWLIFRFSPSCFVCQVCGASSDDNPAHIHTPRRIAGVIEC